MVCGLPCSGKTTLARRLEHEYAALRLTPDEWHLRLFGADLAEPEHDARHDLIETLLWGMAARVLTLGVDVILDFGFWARVEREDYRLRAARLGAGSQVHFLDVSDATLLARLAARNAQLPAGSFWIPEVKLRAWMALFEPPAEEELKSRNIQKG